MPISSFGAALRLLSSAVTIAGAPLCSGSGSRLFVAAGSAELTRGLTAETRTGFQPMAGPASNRAPVTLENAPVPTYNTRRKLPFGCPVANGISRIQTGPNRFFTPRESLVSRNAWASAAAPLHSEVPAQLRRHRPSRSRSVSPNVSNQPNSAPSDFVRMEVDRPCGAD